MNGLIKKSGRKIFLLAAMGGAMTGCRSMENCSTGSCASGACATGKCDKGGCSECGPDGCLFGGAFNHFKNECKDFDPEQLHTDHCWPDQYNRLSRQRVRDPLGTQMNNGIAVESTLWTHYFSNEKGKEGELNEAGMSRLQYFARRKPFVTPNLFLQTSWDKDIDAKRIQTAVDYLAKFSMEPQPWQVAVINSKPTGLFGLEGPKAITKMLGTGAQPPQYEQQIKQGFYSSGSSGGS